MKLFFKLLHEIHRSFLFHRLTAALPVFLGKAGLPLWQMMLRNSIADSPPDCKAGPGEKAALLDETEIRAFKLANFNRWFEQFNSCFHRKTALFLQFVHEKPLQSDKPRARIASVKQGGLCMKFHKRFAWLTVLFFALTMVTGLKKK